MYSEMGEWRKSLGTIEQALLPERALIRRGAGQGPIYGDIWQGMHRMVAMARGGIDDGVTAPRVLPSVRLDRIIRLSQVAHRTKRGDQDESERAQLARCDARLKVVVAAIGAGLIITMDALTVRGCAPSSDVVESVRTWRPRSRYVCRMRSGIPIRSGIPY